MSLIEKPNVLQITPYEPGKPISEVQREYGHQNVIKLASNENPLGPSPKAVDAVREALWDLHRYPDGGGYYLKQKLSGFYNFPTEQIVLGNGSAELVEIIAEALLAEGDAAVTGEQAFFKYRIAVQIMNAKTIWAEMPNLNWDPDALIDAITDRTQLIFIANPNNPTGTMLDRDAADYLMHKVPPKVTVVFDEAYYEYRDPDRYPDTMQYLKDGAKLIILRTFSKAYGLAGLRVGYAFTTKQIAGLMNRVRETFNVNSLGLVGAETALDDQAHVSAGLELNAKGKQEFYSAFDNLHLEYIPTEANFVLVKVPVPGREMFKKLLEKGVVVRPVDGYGLKEYIRVSIGLPKDNRMFFTALEETLDEINRA